MLSVTMHFLRKFLTCKNTAVVLQPQYSPDVHYMTFSLPEDYELPMRTSF
jgi:hypothetical protein